MRRRRGSVGLSPGLGERRALDDAQAEGFDAGEVDPDVEVSGPSELPPHPARAAEMIPATATAAIRLGVFIAESYSGAGVTYREIVTTPDHRVSACGRVRTLTGD